MKQDRGEQMEGSGRSVPRSVTSSGTHRLGGGLNDYVLTVISCFVAVHNFHTGKYFCLSLSLSLSLSKKKKSTCAQLQTMYYKHL